MANLNLQNIGDNYKGILNLGAVINTPLSTTLKEITDGDGVSSPLKLGTTLIGVKSSIIHDWNASPRGAEGKTSTWFDASGRMAWRPGIIEGACVRTFDDTGVTNDRSWILPDANGTFALTTDLSVYLPLMGGTLTGESGTGFHGFIAQGIPPTTPSSGFRLYANSSNAFSWRGQNGFTRTVDGLANTANRTYTLPDATTTLAGVAVANTFTQNQAITAPTLTGSSTTSALSISQTWNTTGNPTMLFMNATNTASGSNANLMDLQVGGVSQFKVTKGGAVTAFGVVEGSNINAKGISYFGNYQSSLRSNSSGVVQLQNTAENDFNRLQWGGSTSLFPSIKRSTTNLQVRLADDSGFTFIEDLYRRAGSGSPEAVVTAPIGAIYHRTDGGASTSLYVKESGAGNTGWLAK